MVITTPHTTRTSQKGMLHLSPHLEQLQQKIKTNYREETFHQRREIFARVFQEHPHEPQPVRMALGLARFLAEKAIPMTEDEVLAGYIQQYDYTYTKPADVNAEIETLFRTKGWQAGHPDREFIKDFQKRCRVQLFDRISPGAHVIAGYDRVLQKGWGTIMQTYRQELDSASGEAADVVRAGIIVGEAATSYIRRYAEKARSLSETTTSHIYAHQLINISQSCSRIATEKPSSFFEAVQLLWLTHEIICIETKSGSFSIGRLDEMLFPFYEEDLKLGRLSREEAADLIEALWIKFNGLRSGYQNVVIGGSDATGEDMTNDISSMCLQASRKLRTDQPLLSVRCHSGLPEFFWEEILLLIEEGLGFPALFNEEVIIDSQMLKGISPEDAWKFGIIGCVEPATPGKEFGHTEEFRLNWAKLLEIMLHGGVCPLTGESIPLKQRRDLDEIQDFEDLYAWFKEEFAHCIELAVKATNIMEKNYSEHWPCPFLSLTMEGCLAKDITDGGTVYNLSTINGCGMANTVDSLTAINQYVFENRSMTLPELAVLLRENFDTQEPVRQRLLHACPKFGNDKDEPDELMNELTHVFCQEVSRYSNDRGGRYQAGLYTVFTHGTMGEMTGALPDGRLSGVSLSNGLSSTQGADQNGPTALMRSLTKLDHRLFGNGMVLDIKFHPSFFSTERHRKAFRHLVDSYFAMGGMEVQFNVVNREILLLAQAQPELYQDLVVRVSGFSAYFNDLQKSIQDEIIARTEHVTFI